jgi:hypothetical protein
VGLGGEVGADFNPHRSCPFFPWPECKLYHVLSGFCSIKLLYHRKSHLVKQFSSCLIASKNKMKNIWKSDSTIVVSRQNKKKKLRGLSPRANYTNRTTAACRRS